MMADGTLSIQYHGNGAGNCARCGTESKSLGRILGPSGSVRVCEACAQQVAAGNHEAWTWANRQVVDSR
jgi:hypothetical protein